MMHSNTVPGMSPKPRVIVYFEKQLKFGGVFSSVSHGSEEGQHHSGCVLHDSTVLGSMRTAAFARATGS